MTFLKGILTYQAAHVQAMCMHVCCVWRVERIEEIPVRNNWLIIFR